LGLTKVSQAAAGRNLWIELSKYPRKYPYFHVRHWANMTKLFSNLLYFEGPSQSFLKKRAGMNRRGVEGCI
jgi:hypothetical protein